MRALILLFFISSCSHRVNIVTPTSSAQRAQFEAKASDYMVASQGLETSKAAISIFKRGGNIIDAFVAASFAISVERPESTGLGGGGFLLYFNRAENKVYSFDFREVAPMASSSKMFLTKTGQTQPLLSQEGALAVGTPGLVAGLFEIHRRFGHLSWSDTLLPAIELAKVGFPMNEHLRVALEDRKNLLHHDPEAKKTFYLPDGSVPKIGSLVIQENLANTLMLIAEKGKDGFYSGSVAKAMVKSVNAKRGILSELDLRRYQMKERTPVKSTYKKFQIFSMPPPSSGGIHVIQILKMLEPHRLKRSGPQSSQAVHLTANSMQRAFLDRATYLGDPDFHPVPVDQLLDEGYLKRLSEEIKTPRAIPAQSLSAVPLPYESSETTHFSIADREGNMIATTQTINGWFGSGIMAQGTGIVMNNEMDDFAQKVGAKNLFGAVGGSNNLVEPKKRPLSSMSPTLLLKDNQPFMSLGSPSGTRIINCVAQTILNAIEFKMPLYEAVAATRVHQQWQPDELKIETPFLSEKVEDKLKALGHNVVHGRLGCYIQAIQRGPDGWTGVSDPRGDGLALGM